MRNNFVNNPSSTISLAAGEGIQIDSSGGTYTITAEEAVPYATRVDQAVDGLTYYIGQAVTGTDTATALWRIKKTVLSGSSDDVITTWADGNSNFDNVWDDRLSLTYL